MAAPATSVGIDNPRIILRTTGRRATGGRDLCARRRVLPDAVATFLKTVVVHAPVAQVFAFHERDDALGGLSPPFPPVRVVSREGGIRAGARVELRIGPIRWLALHTHYAPHELFVDEQVSGPFASWVHRHEFAVVDADTTRLTDRVTFRLRGGALTNALLGPLVTWLLVPMFRFRHRATRQACESAARFP